jgi:hypothetical protein
MEKQKRGIKMTDVEFMTAKEKEMVLKQWVTFVKNGFKWEQFTDRLYKHLTLHCSFIAHYNRHGFYQTYFEQPEDTVKFLKQFDMDYRCRSVEYGADYWVTDLRYSDINGAMCSAIDPYKKGIYERCSCTEKQRDLTLASALLAKHGIQMNV